MTVPHYGKRYPGALTAASPGDTLYFNFGTYNDSGDSEVLSGLAVTDIECFKNGSATARATDSGYSLISDTGMLGDRAGLYRFSIQLFNTADDASFYASGSWYQVAVDAVTIDGKTVRFWVGSFEIGEPRANVVQIAGDTGAANYLKNTFAAGFADTGIQNRLDKIQSDVDTGIQNADILRVRGDTGAGQRFFRFLEKLDTGGDLSVSSSVDTGIVNQAVWQANAQRKLTVDTGIADQVWMQTRASYTADTGTFGEHLGGSLGTAVVDTGVVNQAVWQGNATRVLTANTNLSGLSVNLNQIRGDTGGADRFYRYTQKLDTGGDATVSASVDTGQVNNAVWNGARSAHTAAGSFGQYVNANLVAVLTDTGAAHLDAGRLGVSAAATVDTGLVANAIWNSARSSHTTAGTFGEYVNANVTLIDGDTGSADVLAKATNGTGGVSFSAGIAVNSLVSAALNSIVDAVWDEADTGHADTGTFGRLRRGVNVTKLRGDTGGADRLFRYTQKLDTGGDATVSAAIDTGQVNQAVWQANAIRGITAISDTGLNDSLGRIRSDVDTGLRAQISDVDTGLHDTLADYDTGVRALLALRDTGAIANAVWNFTTRGITASSDTGLNSRFSQVTVTGFSDTGVNDRLAKILADTDTGIQSSVNVTAFADTGINNRLAVIAADTDTGIQSSVNVTGLSDTGIYSQFAALATASALATVDTVVDAIKAKTDSLTFTVAGFVDANLQYVNDVAITGTGDTGTGNTWRPA